MDETTENFLKVMSEFEWPEIKSPIYRVYYDDNGQPTLYTMQDLPGNYIEISKDDFWLASMKSRVINGKLVHLTRNNIVKLRPRSLGTPCHPLDVSIIVSENQSHINWSIDSNETN